MPSRWILGLVVVAGGCVSAGGSDLAERLGRVEERLAQLEDEMRAVRERHTWEDLRRVLAPSTTPPRGVE